MATDLENAIRSAAKIAQYVKDVTTMTVQTSCVPLRQGVMWTSPRQARGPYYYQIRRGL